MDTQTTNDNQVTITLQSRSVNEQFARTAVAAFIAPLDPSVAEMNDIKTAVSEAVTNAIIHGYADKSGEVRLMFRLEGRKLTVEVSDDGAGIDDVARARQPLYTTKPEIERSGMGFTVMESFMDTVQVQAETGRGVTVVMTKTLTDTASGHPETPGGKSCRSSE